MFGGTRVDLGPVTLGGVDDSGVGWHISTLEGWDSAEVRTQTTQREADHGAWMGPVYLGERAITLGGTIDAPSSAALDAAVERLLAACSLTDTVLTVYESIPKRAVVRRSGKAVVQRVTATAATYSLLVTAPDPRRYGADLQSGTTYLPFSSGGLVLPVTLPAAIAAVTGDGQITATNGGTIATRPLLTVTGPCPAPRVAALYSDGSQRVLSYAQDLAGGEVLTIDTDAHTVMLGGTASRRRYLSGQWPALPAGQTVTLLFQAALYNPTAMLTATWRSAWI